jgi:DNA mismatch repair protein MutH
MLLGCGRTTSDDAAGGTVYDLTDAESVLQRARALVGRRLGEVTSVAAEETMTTRSRGTVGHHLERYFGLQLNSDQEPDFSHLGVELKSVPMVPQGNSHAAKERTFITAIDYATVSTTAFEGSALDRKTRTTLYIFYGWRPAPVTVADLRVLRVLLHERDDLDELTLREAYRHVQAAVAAGRAHELSESDTWGVGPATKDARARDVPQPHGPEPARRRAFAWRAAYTTRLFQVARLTDEPIVEAPDALLDLVADATDRLLPHYGRTVAELRDRYAPQLSDGAKSLASGVTRAVLGSEGGRDLEAFDRLGITVRTARAERTTLRPFESTSFPAIDFLEVVETPWDASPLQEQLNAVLFVIYVADRGQRPPAARLHTAFLWRPTDDEVDVMEREYEAFRTAIATRTPDRWPTARDTEILHVRPHGRDKGDRRPLPTGGDHVRSAFWLNQSYVRRLIQRSQPL